MDSPAGRRFLHQVCASEPYSLIISEPARAVNISGVLGCSRVHTVLMIDLSGSAVADCGND